MTEHEEEMARFRAEMDQALEGIKTVTRAAWVMFSEAQEQGFTEEQAFTMTLQWIAAAAANSGKGE